MHSYFKHSIGYTLALFWMMASGITLAEVHNPSKAWPASYVGTYFGHSGSAVSLHPDGTIYGVSSEMFSDDPTGTLGGRKSTPSAGVWQVVGKNKVRMTNLRFITEQFGHNYTLADGAILKTSFTAIFEEPVKGKSPGYSVDWLTVEVFVPGQNPTTDEPVDVLEFPFQGGGSRLAVN